MRDITDDNSNKGAGASHREALQHPCKSVKGVTITLNGATLEGADAVMFTPPAVDHTSSGEQHRSVLNTYGTILSSDDAFNRAFDWQAAQKHTDVAHMKADISITGVFSCKATGDTAPWTLHDVEITHVNRNVDLLAPGTYMYQFQAIADRR